MELGLGLGLESRLGFGIENWDYWYKDWVLHCMLVISSIFYVKSFRVMGVINLSSVEC